MELLPLVIHRNAHEETVNRIFMDTPTQEELDRLKNLWNARATKVQWTSLMLTNLDVRDDDADLTLALHNHAPALIAAAEALLSNSTPQPPRYTLEEILAEFQSTYDALDREDAPTVKSAYGLAIAHLKQMIADSLPLAPQQKEAA